MYSLVDASLNTLHTIKWNICSDEKMSLLEKLGLVQGAKVSVIASYFGNVVENVIYKNGELFRSFKWQYIYNEFGLIETRSYYVDDMLSWVEKNEYSQK